LQRVTRSLHAGSTFATLREPSRHPRGHNVHGFPDDNIVSLKTLFTLVAPGALTLAAGGALLYLPQVSHIAAQASRGYPLVALAVAVLLAWRMHRSRVLLTALLLLGVYGVTHLDAAAQAAANATLSAAVNSRADATAAGVAMAAVLLPLLVAGLAFASDRNVAGRVVALQTLVVGAVIAVAAVFVVAMPAEASLFLKQTFIDPVYTSWTHLDQVTLLAAMAGLCVLAGLALFRGRATDAGLGWAAVAGLIAIAASSATGPDGTPAGDMAAHGIWMLAAGLILVITLVESSYMMAFHDDLTGLPARRVLSQTLSALRPPYTVAIVDVDHFKSFNDRYGHDVGDEVLRMVATRLAAVTGGGRAYRSGGEEFTIVFPGKTKAEALPHVEQVREAVAAAKFTLRKQPRPAQAEGERRRGKQSSSDRRIGVTISVGLAGVDRRNATTDAVVKAADKAMYRAKKNGRNRVVA
jgi:diguanylate cyclase (GGDEF)-like protein